MKIAYVISYIESKCSGFGGHYHSLSSTMAEMSKSHEVFVIVVGKECPNSISQQNFRVYSILDSKFRFFRTLKTLRQIVGTEVPDVIHAFDDLAFLWVRTASLLDKVPCCVTKCGGRNPVYWPRTSNLILYSRENQEYFARNSKHKDANILLLPNRIGEFRFDEVRSRMVTDKVMSRHPYARTIMRISRIGPYYLRTARQLISLITKLRLDGVDCCGILIGSVESTETLRQLKAIAGEHIYIFEDSYFSKDAKQLIGVADIVLGTGRSLMEAAAAAKVLLCPVSDSDIPLLIDDASFEQAFGSNFSERTTMGEICADANYKEISYVLTSEDAYNRLSNFSASIYREYFDVSQIDAKLSSFYRNLRTSNTWWLGDLLLHLLFVVRKYLQSK